MQSDAPLAANSTPDQGLPPVAPPDARFLAKLFVVPLLIVSSLVIIAIAFTWFRGLSQTPEYFLKKLDSDNPEERWRGAEDLAQTLLRNDQLAADAKFTLDLTERLATSSQVLRRNEQALADRAKGMPADQAEKERKALEPERNYVLYLSACLGHLVVPTAVPVLKELAGEESNGSATSARRRWRAIWALANLGENLKRFDKLPPERQGLLLAQLEEEANASSAERGTWARQALAHLKNRLAGQPDTMGIDVTLAQCAKDQNPFLRTITAFALNFWSGRPAENALIEATLVQLSHDDGRGVDLMARQYESEEVKPDNRFITRVPGLETRYNATVALLRRGSDQFRFGILLEMLDEELQLSNFRVERKNGEEVADEPTARSTIVGALRALIEYHKQQPDGLYKRPAAELDQLKLALDKLTHSSNPTLQSEAERTRAALNLAK
jgi:hypothetical protein